MARPSALGKVRTAGAMALARSCLATAGPALVLLSSLVAGTGSVVARPDLLIEEPRDRGCERQPNGR